MPGKATSKWWKEERQGVFLDYNQNAKDRTVASAYSVRPLPDARVSTPLMQGRGSDVQAGGVHDRDGARAVRDPWRPWIGHRRGRRIVGGPARAVEAPRGRGLGDAPWPPNYAKQAGEPPRVQPSRKRRPDSEYDAGRGEAGGRHPTSRWGASGGGGRRGPERRAPDRLGGFAPDADRTAADQRADHRDLPRGDEGRGARRSRPVEGAPLRGGKGARAGGCPGGWDARPLIAVVPRAGQSHPCAGGASAGAGKARSGLRPVGRLRMARPVRSARARLAEEVERL